MKISVIHTGFFKLDGGPMFGVVPRRMWEKMNPPDEKNMCTWAMRALLVQHENRNILVDTGIGNKQDAKFRSHFEPHGTQSLFGSLEQLGLSRSDITDVFLTHLHFDHCGGALWKNETSGDVELSFPNATYWSNKSHWEWAMDPNPREKASFLQENFVPLLERGCLKFVEETENVEWIPGIRVRFCYGHTEAMMLPVIDTGEKTLVYCADLLPAQWHVGAPYVMAYDIRPLQTIREKEKLLSEAAEKNEILFLEHDPFADCLSVRRDDTGKIIVDRIGTLQELMS